MIAALGAAEEKPVIFRGQGILRNRDGLKANRFRWSLSPSNLQQLNELKSCKHFKMPQQTNKPQGNGFDDERVLRCEAGKAASAGKYPSTDTLSSTLPLADSFCHAKAKTIRLSSQI